IQQSNDLCNEFLLLCRQRHIRLMNTYCYSIQCNSVSAARNKVSSKELLAQFSSPARNRYKVHLQSLRRPVFLLHMLDKSLTVVITFLVFSSITFLSTAFVC